jgi:hypothetical protein
MASPRVLLNVGCDLGHRRFIHHRPIVPESILGRRPAAMRSLNGVGMVLVSRKIQSTGDLNTLQSFGFHRSGNDPLVPIWRGNTAPANKQLPLASISRKRSRSAGMAELPGGGSSNANAIPCRR